MGRHTAVKIFTICDVLLLTPDNICAPEILPSKAFE